MLYTTLKEILDNSPCSLEKVEQLKTFIEFEVNGFTETTAISLSSVLKSNGLKDTYWVLNLTEQGRHLLKRYILWNAEKVLPICEKAFPNDNQSRLAIEAARKAIENPTYENKKAAADAAYAAYAAASYASYASYAASSAAAYATSSASYASYAAYAASYASYAAADAVEAAAAASYDEAYKKFEKEQEIELLRLLEEATL